MEQQSQLSTQQAMPSDDSGQPASDNQASENEAAKPRWADIADDAADTADTASVEAMEVSAGATNGAPRKRQRGGDKESIRLNKKRRKEAKAKAQQGPEGAASTQPRARKDNNERTVFITNLSFSTKEEALLDWLKACGDISKVVLGKDKATDRPVGFAHIVFEAADSVQKALKYDKQVLLDRVVRVAQAGKEHHIEFRLPEDLEDEVRDIAKKYEGMNISCIKDAWEKQHPGQKFDVQKFGFKNFSTAVKSISGITLETHLDKSLTFVAFMEGSDAHIAFRRSKEDKAAQAPTSEGKDCKMAPAEDAEQSAESKMEAPQDVDCKMATPPELEQE